MALTNKTIASSYQDILQLENGGSGRTANGTNVKDGLGQSTSLTLGQNKLHIKPGTDQTDAFLVESASGGDLINVDTSSQNVKLGSTQTFANTQIQEFSVFDLQPTADTHTAMFTNGFLNTSTAPITLGTGTDPATTFTLGDSEANAMALVASSWYIPTNILIDEVRVIAAGESADTLNFHLFKYTIAGGTSSTSGDLSSGELVAYNSSALAINSDRVTTTTLSFDDASVAANKVVIATVENVGATTDVAAKLIVKYHFK